MLDDSASIKEYSCTPPVHPVWRCSEFHMICTILCSFAKSAIYTYFLFFVNKVYAIHSTLLIFNSHLHFCASVMHLRGQEESQGSPKVSKVWVWTILKNIADCYFCLQLCNSSNTVLTYSFFCHFMRIKMGVRNEKYFFYSFSQKWLNYKKSPEAMKNDWFGLEFHSLYHCTILDWVKKIQNLIFW